MSTQVVPVRSLRFNLDWITRPVFGIALAALAIAAIAAGRWYFAAFVGAAAIGAAREWHRMVERRALSREFWLSGAAMTIALTLLTLDPHSTVPWLLLGIGTFLVMLSAHARRANSFWPAGGVVYIGAPALLLVALRATGSHGAWIIAGFLLVVWATDTGALIAGNLIGGPKLWPKLSPNKTWAGTLGGTLIAVAIGALYVRVLGGSAMFAAVYALLISLVAHAGDLFESAAKRNFSLKDSGGLIPGHGGVLDRIDSALAVSAVVGVGVLGAGLDPMFGATP